MPPSDIDCTLCGACCFGGHDRYIALLPLDAGRAIPAEARTEIDGRGFLRMAEGHCAQLCAAPGGRAVCGIYEVRPEACRAFRAGSFECGRARHHRGDLAAAFRGPAFAVPEPVVPVQMEGPEADPPPAHVIAAMPKGRFRPPA